MSFVPNKVTRVSLAVAGAALVALGFVHPLSAETPTGTATEAPKNLARLNCGARLEVTSHVGIGDAANTRTLLLDDQTLDYELRRGDTSFVVTLPKISLVDRFTFINEKAELNGTVQVSVSNSRPATNDYGWQSAGRDVRITGQRFINVPLTGLEAKYVRINFHVDRDGTIAGIGLYGRKTLQSFSQQRKRVHENGLTVGYIEPTNRSYDGLHYNFANLYAKARVVHVSSGSAALAQRMIDDDPVTSFEFAADDAHPTVVIELAENERLRRVSAVYEMQPGKLEIYLLERMPGNAADLNFDQLHPVLTLTDENGSGKAAADFNPMGARYVALRWTPLGGFSKHRTFKMCEIGAFSDNSNTLFGWVDVPERLATTSIVTELPPGPPVVIPVSQ